MHELRELVHCKKDVGLSEGEVLHRTNDLMVFSEISWKGPIIQLKGHGGDDQGGNSLAPRILCFSSRSKEVCMALTLRKYAKGPRSLREKR